MKDSRIEKLASNLLNHSINLQKGEKINEEQYKALEETPQSIMRNIESNEYRQV